MKRASLQTLALAFADHRVVTAEQLRLAGADDSAIFRARRSDVLQEVPGIDGVYVVGPEPYDDLVRMHIAVKVAGPGSVITGTWAARLLKMPWIPDEGSCLVRIDQRFKRRGSEGFVRVCRTRTMERLTTWEHEGLLIATAPLAAVDAARQIQEDSQTRQLHEDRALRDVRGIILGAVAQEHCTIEQIEAALGVGSTRWTAHIRRSVADAHRGAASPPEAEVVDGLLPYGIPFYCNVEVWSEGRLVGVIDVLLVGTGAGGEMDSVQEHAEGTQLDLTLVRSEAFRDLGFDLRHITPTRYRGDPGAFHRTLIRVAMERLSRGLGDPPGVVLRPRGPLLCGELTAETPYVLPAAA